MLRDKIKKLKYPAAVFLALSLFTHFFVYVVLAIYSHLPKTPKKEVVEIEFVEPQKLKPRNQKQIVQQEKQINDEVPEDAKYMSKFNQTVKKQTRAAKSGAFKNTAQPGQQVAGSKQAPKKPSQKVANQTKPKKSAQKKPSKDGPSKVKKLSDLIPKYSLTPDARKELARHVGDPSQTDDYLKDVENGLQTALSTREFLYYSYYDRIKKRIRQFWEPNVRQQVKMIYRKGRSIASSSDRVTQVLITLDSSGTLERIEVITQSGVSALDDAAVKAFKQAAPFPNPPKGMVEKDGRIRIRWDFILEANVFRIQRNQKYASLARPDKSF